MRSILYSFLVLCMVGAAARAQTDGESELAAVRAAFLDYVDAVNDRDVDRIEEHYFQGTVSNFDRRGGRLLEINSGDANSDIGALIDFDLASDQGIRILTEDLDVHVYGDSAIVTGYWVGRHRSDGEIADFGPFRFSSVWVRDGGRWREAHRHSSFLQAGGPGRLLRPIPVAPPPPLRVRSRLRVPASDIEGNLIQKVAPEYPGEARYAGIRGVVVLEIVVKVSGEVEVARVISGHPLLRAPATQAVEQWRYRSGGTSVDVVTTVEVTFPP